MSFFKMFGAMLSTRRIISRFSQQKRRWSMFVLSVISPATLALMLKVAITGKYRYKYRSGKQSGPGGPTFVTLAVRPAV